MGIAIQKLVYHLSRDKEHGFEVFMENIFPNLSSTKDFKLMISELNTDHHLAGTFKRSSGKTCALIGYALWKAITVPNYNIVFVSSMNGIKDMDMEMLMSLAHKWDIPVLRELKGNLRFSNNSRVFFGTSWSTKYLRGNRYDELLIDEAGMADKSSIQDLLYAVHGKIVSFTTFVGASDNIHSYFVTRAKIYPDTNMSVVVGDFDYYART